MGQISFFAADVAGPSVADLAGLLCAHGRILAFGGTAARLSITVDERARADALVAEFARRGVTVRGARVDQGYELATAFRADLLDLAGHWGGTGTKTVPEGFRLDGGALRLWALAAGSPAESGHVFGFDAAAPQTHEALTSAFGDVGFAGRAVSPLAEPAGVLISGRRGLIELTELLGPISGAVEPWWPRCPPPERPREAPAGRTPTAGDRAGQLTLLSA